MVDIGGKKSAGAAIRVVSHKVEFEVWAACRVRTNDGWRTECSPLSVMAADAGEARLTASGVYDGWLRERMVSSYRILCAIMKEDMRDGKDEQGHGF